MVEPTSNDNEVARPPGRHAGRDAHGQAAILLVESLIHGLIERSILSIADAVEIVGDAIDVKEATGEEIGECPAALAESLVILSVIRTSLTHDLPNDSGD